MVNTFVPVSDSHAISCVLDKKRLYKQIVECKQIATALRVRAQCLRDGNHKMLNIRTGRPYGYVHHPATLQWVGHLDALQTYMSVMFSAWANETYGQDISISAYSSSEVAGSSSCMPAWFNDSYLHMTHRAKLYEKDPKHYAGYYHDYDYMMCVYGCVVYLWADNDPSANRGYTLYVSTAERKRYNHLSKELDLLEDHANLESVPFHKIKVNENPLIVGEALVPGYPELER